MGISQLHITHIYYILHIPPAPPLLAPERLLARKTSLLELLSPLHLVVLALYAARARANDRVQDLPTIL